MNPIQVYLVGGGIASMAAAAFMIRDGDVPGHNITILEELDKLGGSLDGSGSPQNGYVLRGGRMLESKYLCTCELFSSIPTLDESRTVTQEIFEWNEAMKTSSKSRLVRVGLRQTAPEFGLSEKHILTIERLALEPEAMLGKTSIADQFDPTFFKTNFWFMWCTTFAFQPSVAVLASAAANIVSGAAVGFTPAIGSTGGQSAGPMAGFVDLLLRANPPITRSDAGDVATARGELDRLFTSHLSTGEEFSPADRTYLAQVVAALTGVNQADAENRVSQVIAQAKSAVDSARKAGARFALWLTASLLLGAFSASLAATEGGGLRDGTRKY